MRKKTLVSLYTLALLIFGGLIIILGFAFGNIESFSSLSGANKFVFAIKIMGFMFIAAGIGGLAWGLLLSENPTLPGYAGLHGAGLVTFLLFFLVGGPFWLLVGWAMWWIPMFRARPSAAEG
ncbi:hypothetical protein [Salinibacter ruber]|uniref:hypothetical protein n=1 Tax=Salinibacter ruber TaxID=146919 RepID=UPI0013AF9B40|nr:hypothetical protein [Salinibacter ruber]MCS3643651.1 hypothetical protein [Salinibacter ruber]MCS3684896.1 hypothetical protein [Salinibacter ruber]MCS3853675.1 hypothetical protein [Salinibacter ruber]